jgi:hypothetical protein
MIDDKHDIERLKQVISSAREYGYLEAKILQTKNLEALYQIEDELKHVLKLIHDNVLQLGFDNTDVISLCETIYLFDFAKSKISGGFH